MGRPVAKRRSREIAFAHQTLQQKPDKRPLEGLRLRLANSAATVVFSLSQKPWAEKFDAHSQSLDILQRFTGPNSYTRSYEDLFRDFQQEDFRPRFTSPAVGRGVDLTAEVAADVERRSRSARHPRSLSATAPCRSG